MLTSTRAGQPQNIDAIALPPGGHPNKIVVADDKKFVEHPGNAGRPHAAANQPQHQPATERARRPRHAHLKQVTRVAGSHAGCP